MDLDRPLPPLPHPSQFESFDAGDDDYDSHSPSHFRSPFDYTESELPPPPPSAAAMIGRRLARRCERACCLCATYFPLGFVYGLASWALWVDVKLGTTPEDASHAPWIGPWCAVVAFVLYVMQLWSYTTAVFRSPGSTTNDQGYSTVPTGLGQGTSLGLGSGTTGSNNFTVKSNGEMRFCKKCQARKPDRAHHCSTCRRCVLKMDHHCPWLANCIGLRNGKAFLLFLVYTTLFGIFSFFVSGAWVWTEIVNDATYTNTGDSFMPVMYIMLCVVGGIMGLVVGLFTAWHLYLACRGQTTIECMEKTRYNSSLRSSATFAAAATVAGAINDGFSGNGNHGSHGSRGSHEQGVPLPQYGRQMARNGQPIRDEEQGLFDGIEGAHDDDDDDYDDNGGNSSYNSTYANDSAGVNRGPHDQMGRRLTYNDLERYRAQKRHEAYLDEQESEKMPHAFDLGVRRNLLHMFGPRLWLWPFPVCTTTGDGWSWEPSPKWLAARDRIQQERNAQRDRERAAGWGVPDDDTENDNRGSPPIIVTSATPPRPRYQNQPSPLRQQPQQQQQQQTQNLSTLAPQHRATTPSRYRRPPPSGVGQAPPLTSPSSKADRILGRSPTQYADTIGPPAAAIPTSPSPLSVQNGNGVSLQRLNPAGRTLHNDEDLFVDENEDDDELDNTSEEEPSKTTAAAAPSTTSKPRPVSPLRARWMPDPASGLLRRTGSSSPSSTPVQHSPTAELASPIFGGGSEVSAAPAPAVNGHGQQYARTVVNDADDGSVD